MRRLRLAVLVALSAVIAPGGCGGTGSSGSGNADKVKASFAQFVHDLRRRNVAAACDGMTPAFWSALAGELNGSLVGVGRPVSAGDLRAGLRSLFEMLGQGAIFRTAVRATDVAVHGTTATARQADGGSQPVPLRFIEQGGRWRVDCCIGRQR